MDTSRFTQMISTMEAQAEPLATPCHGGEMWFRRWSGPPDAETVLLVHGGSGSWLHWVKNIAALREQCHVLAVDLPGLGDSASLPDGYAAADAVAVFLDGTRQVTRGERIHIIAFSWGCAVAAQAAHALEDRLGSLLLVGPASLGDIPRRGTMQPLIRRSADMTVAEVHAANRENLARLMIHDRSRIDDFAVWIQTRNTNLARFASPQFARSTLVLDGVARSRVPLKVIYGEFDAPALPDVAGRQRFFDAVRDDVEFEIAPDAGHWVAYEHPDWFNECAQAWVARHRRLATR